MKCFYHSSDLDGHCSAAIVALAYPECEMIPINYEDDFPWDRIEQDEIVYMVDFGLQPFEQMIDLHDRATLIWIDHHKTAINEAANQPEDLVIKGSRNTDYAGCELTWMYIYPEKDMPRAVFLLGRYDVWDHSNEDVYPFQMGMRIREMDPQYVRAQDRWASLLIDAGDQKEMVIEQIIGEGKTIITYQDQVNAKISTACAFEVELDGLTFIAANMQGANSRLFNAVWNDLIHDAMLLFGWKKGQWTVSMFTTSWKIAEGIDVGQVAKQRGGGGHAGAAGFQCQTLPFKLK